MNLRQIFSNVKKTAKKFAIISRLFHVYVFLNIYSCIFYLSNSGFFSPNYFDILVVLWFNLVTLCLFFLPYGVLIFFPAKGKVKNTLNKIGDAIFFTTVALLFFLISVGIAVYPFSLKHLSFDYLIYFLFDNEETNLFSYFLIEYFWLFIIFLSSIVSLFYLKKKISIR